MRQTLQDIFSAGHTIGPHIRATPLDHSAALSERFKIDIYLKLENWQITGSFKIRGALNKMLGLSAEEKSRGVVTASAGNHGLGVAYAARLLGIEAKIFVPENASSAKVAALSRYPIELIERGADYDDSEEHAKQLANDEKRALIHGFSDPAVISGQGTIGLEIIETLPDVDAVIVPIGGGGLISGLACTIKSIHPKTRVYGVQSEASPAMYNAIKAGRPVETPISETIADGLAGRFVTKRTLRSTIDYVDDVWLVSEASIINAMKLLLETEHILVEGSAAVGLAALLEGKLTDTGKVVLVLTGRNIDAALLDRLW